MHETTTEAVDDAIRGMERRIRRTVETALAEFKFRTGLQPSEIEVVMQPCGSRLSPEYELDAVRRHLPGA